MTKQSLQRVPHRVKPLKTKKRTARSLLQNTGLLISVLLVVSVGMLLYGLLFLPSFTVGRIDVQGISGPEKDRIVATIERSFPRELWLANITSIITADVNEAKERVLQEFPQVQSVEARRAFPNTLVLTVEERTPFAVWCREENECVVIDMKGVAFEIEEGRPVPEFHIIPNRKEGALGEQVVEAETVEFLSGITKALEVTRTVTPKKAEIFSDSKITVTTSEGWELYSNPKENQQWQVEKLKAVLERELSSEERAALQYIDLRFGDQVYYK